MLSLERSLKNVDSEAVLNSSSEDKKERPRPVKDELIVGGVEETPDSVSNDTKELQK